MGSRSLRPLLLACTALMASSAILPAHAQDATPATTTTGDETQLQTIVVKGKRVKAGSVADTPLATETTAEEIRQKEITDPRQLSNEDPSVDYVRTRPGASGGLYIRGLTGARISTLIDGVPIPYIENTARSGTQSPTTTTGDSSDSYDFSSLSSIDIVKGADSSRLGGGSLAGGVILRTLEPEDLIGESKDWGVVSKTNYDSADSSFGSSVAAAKKVENTSVLFQAGYKKGHELQGQGDVGGTGVMRTEVNPADYTQYNMLLKLRQDLEGGHRIGLTAERFHRDTDTTLNTIQGTGSASTGVYQRDYVGFDTTARDRVSVDYTYEAIAADSLIDSASLVAYWQRLEKVAGSSGTRLRTTTNVSYLYERENSLSENDYGLTGQVNASVEAGGLAHEITVGGDVALFGAESFLSAVPTTTVSQSDIPDVDGVRFGAYLQDKITFNGGPFSLTPGFRFDLYDYNTEPSDGYSNNTGSGYFGLPDDANGSAFSPKLLASYDLTPNLQLFAQWSMAYRAPTVNELYLNFTNASSGYATVGNADLEAETGQGFEIGANFEDGANAARVVGFYNKYRNFIEQYETTTDAFSNPFTGGDGTLYTYRNLDRVRIAGVEASARKRFDSGFLVHASLAYTYGEDESTGEYLRSVAPFKSVIGVGYETATWGADFSGVFSAGMRDDGTQYTSTGTAYETFDAPGYGVFNLSGWWAPEQFQGLRIQAGVYNIFDKTYWNAVATRDVQTTGTSYQPADYYSEPGRTFKISLTQKF